MIGKRYIAALEPAIIIPRTQIPATLMPIYFSKVSLLFIETNATQKTSSIKIAL